MEESQVIQIAGKNYELLKENKDGWKPEAFRDRYSEVLDRYDFIVGDWGYSQLRLKGFYADNHAKANKETSINGLQDYLVEHCNFGCAYFILGKVKSQKEALHIPVEGSTEPVESSDTVEPQPQ